MRPDPVTTQVVRYALERVADEMGLIITRTARSTQIKEIKDVSCAVFDARGQTVAQAHHAPMLLTGFPLAMRYLLERYRPEEVAPGDVIACNDPYLGGQHVMDLILFSPVFLEGELVGWVGSMAHHTDLGGAAPGGVAGGMTEIYQEGIRIPFLKLYRAGEENTDLMALLDRNIRVPELTLADIRSQAAATLLGAQRAAAVFARYGVPTVQASLELLLSVAERRIREGLKALPDGEFAGEDWVDDDGVTSDPIPIRVTLRKRGDEVEVDFTGTSPQVRGNVNCPLASAMAAVYYTIIAVVDPHVPVNAGAYRPVRVHAPPGSLVHPLPPAAVAARSNTSMKVVNALMQAWAGCAPHRVTAGDHGQITNCSFAGYRPEDGRPFVFIDISHGGMGARATKDGRDGQDCHLARFMNTPAEAIELEFPVRVERMEFIPDSGGAGRFRGALGFRRDIRVLVPVTWARYGDRQRRGAPGLAGGLPGAPGRFLINPDTSRQQAVPSKGVSRLEPGDVVSLRLPGGGGYGDPLQRDPQAVAEDVRDGKVSREAAREAYGVVLNPQGEVDAEATRALRAARRASRAPTAASALASGASWPAAPTGEGEG